MIGRPAYACSPFTHYDWPDYILCLTMLEDAVLAVTARRVLVERRGFVTRAVACEGLTGRRYRSALREVGDLRGVAVVGVDTGQDTHARGEDVRHLDVASVLRTAITARAVQLAGVLDDEVGDLDGAWTIVLNHLVGGLEGSASSDGHHLAAITSFEADRVFTHISDPNVLERATAAFTMDAVGGGTPGPTDDDVLQNRALGQHEDGLLALGLIPGAQRVGIRAEALHAVVLGARNGDGR